MADGMVTVILSAPERENRAFECQEVLAPGTDGVFTVRAGHTPLLTTLIPGVVQLVDKNEKDEFYAVGCGFAEVRNDTVTILVDTCEEGKEIDVKRAQEAEQRAETRLNKPGEDTDLIRAENALWRSLARIQAGGGRGY